jgi:hypothetical protein
MGWMDAPEVAPAGKWASAPEEPAYTLEQVAASQRPFPGQDPEEWKAMKLQAARSGALTLSPERAAQQAEIDKPVEQAMRDQGGASAFTLGLGQGASFGFGDEIQGGMGAIAGAAKDALQGNFSGMGSRMGDNYAQVRDMMRGANETADFTRPKTYTGGQVAGGIAASATGLTGATGLATSLGGKAALGAASGALEGGLYGFGSGEGGLENRAFNAGKMAAIGGGAGAAAPVAMAGLRLGGRAIANPIMNALNIGSDTQASRMIEKLMKRAGATPDDIQAALQTATREGQPEYVLADALGTTGQRGLSGISRQPGEARQQISDFVMKRQGNQGNRLSGFIADGLQAPDTAAARSGALTAARGDAASVAYDAARAGAGPVDIRGAVGAIDDRVAPMRGSGVALDGIDKKLEAFRNRLAARNPAQPNTSVELSDFDRVLGVKQDLGDAIGEAVRAGRNNEARELMKLQGQIDASLEASSGAYRSANDGFAKASREIDAIDQGAAATSGRVRSADTAAQYSGMQQGQQAAFKAGYADPLIAKIDASALGVNKARPLLNDKTQADFGLMAQDPALLQRQIGREQTMFETGAQALGGSKTADNLGDIADVKQNSASVIMNLLSMRPGVAAQQLADKLLSAASGQSPKTREKIAMMLLSQNPQAAIAPAIQNAARSSRNDMIAGLIAKSMATRTAQ